MFGDGDLLHGAHLLVLLGPSAGREEVGEEHQGHWDLDEEDRWDQDLDQEAQGQQGHWD